MARPQAHGTDASRQILDTEPIAAGTPEQVAERLREALNRAARDRYYGEVAVAAKHEGGVIQNAELRRLTPKRPAD